MNIFNNLLFQYYIGKLKKEMEGIKKLSGKDREKKIKNILEKNEERGNKEKILKQKTYRNVFIIGYYIFY